MKIESCGFTSLTNAKAHRFTLSRRILFIEERFNIKAQLLKIGGMLNIDHTGTRSDISSTYYSMYHVITAQAGSLAHYPYPCFGSGV